MHQEAVLLSYRGRGQFLGERNACCRSQAAGPSGAKLRPNIKSWHAVAAKLDLNQRLLCWLIARSYSTDDRLARPHHERSAERDGSGALPLNPCVGAVASWCVRITSFGADHRAALPHRRQDFAVRHRALGQFDPFRQFEPHLRSSCSRLVTPRLKA
jgi:hypothetical protein